VNVAKQVPKELPSSLLSDNTNKYKIYLCETNRRIHRRSRGYQSPEGYQMIDIIASFFRARAAPCTFE